jgi:hypothetical protein
VLPLLQTVCEQLDEQLQVVVATDRLLRRIHVLFTTRLPGAVSSVTQGGWSIGTEAQWHRWRARAVAVGLLPAQPVATTAA